MRVCALPATRNSEVCVCVCCVWCVVCVVCVVCGVRACRMYVCLWCLWCACVVCVVCGVCRVYVYMCVCGVSDVGVCVCVPYPPREPVAKAIAIFMRKQKKPLPATRVSKPKHLEFLCGLVCDVYGV